MKEIPEEDWQDIEVVGWLYQFYISERKDQVIGAKSKVAAADIPAATQLFTPHWIVRYMVENSLGRLWLEGHPESKLREHMPYYLEAGVQGAGCRGDFGGGRSLTPQELTVIDPACGSGHILVYAFELLFEIYKEQGYLERDIPALILTHNLYGLDIDERAAQLASFAVLMKARAKNSRILRKPLALNITAVRPTHSQTLPPAAELKAEDWEPLVEAFKNADNLGSLITPPPFDAQKLKAQLEKLEVSDRNPLFREHVPALQGLLLEAELLSKQYWVVVANTPYMGNKSLNTVLKDFASTNFPDSNSDAFSMFVERLNGITHSNSFIGLITPFVWRFLSSYENFTIKLLENYTTTSLIQLEYNAFEPACIPVCSFCLKKVKNNNLLGTYIKLSDFRGHQNQAPKTLEAIQNPNCGYLYYAKSADFAKISGSAIAYWVTERLIEVFAKSIPLSQVASPRKGMVTADNPRFIRFWHEVYIQNIGFGLVSRKQSVESRCRWFPYQKGGDFRKWYGNHNWVVDWENDGHRLLNMQLEGYKVGSTNHNLEYIFKSAIIWSKITSSQPCYRYSPGGFLFDDASGLCPAINKKNEQYILGFLSTKINNLINNIINPTLNIQPGNITVTPMILCTNTDIEPIINKAIYISKTDWDNFETSWDFQTHPLLWHNIKHLSEAFTIWQSTLETAFRELQRLEEENNRYWIEVYGLQDELTPEVPDDQITIRRADLDRDVRSLISYAVGCMMGRYSLDKPGLIHAGQPFDPTLHQTFPAAANAIIPITDRAYFDNDIVTRFVEFLRVAYSPETLTENLNFIANALKLKNGESAQERIRRYFAQEFISDHIQTYKKRPIYWLFTSGKKRAFGALVYLHRYNEDTLARIRIDYVLELQVKLDGEITRAQQQLDNASSSTAKKAATNRLKELQAQQLELREYQAKLQNLADARIKLDLDDGVAYNYTRFKGLVYEGSDLKMADLEKASQWKLELLG